MKSEGLFRRGVVWKKPVLLLTCLLLMQACITRAPKYTRVARVMQVKRGMTLEQVSSTLQIQPYSIKSLDTLNRRVLIYKFRTEDRKTLSFLLKDTNGHACRGPFMDFFAYFNERDTLYKFETAEATSTVNEQRLNIDKFVTFITVTAPAVLVAIGLSKTK
jgi:hypothetical protein